MTSHPDGKDILLALLSAAGLLVCGLGALCLAVLAVWSSADAIPMQQEITIWSSIALAAIGLCGVPGLWTAIRGMTAAGQPAARKTGKWWSLTLLGLPLALLSNHGAQLDVLPAVLGPLSNLLTASFAAILSIQLVRLYAPRISQRRGWAQFLTGVYIAPPLILLLELAALIPIAVLMAATVLTGPVAPPSMETLLDPGFNPQDYWGQVNLEDAFNPAGTALLVVYLGLIVPIIEEAIKTAGIWLLFRRIRNAGEAYLAGALVGAGYGLFEGLMLSQPGPDWLMVGLLRIGATFLHTAAAAFTTWGLYKAFHSGKWWIAAATYSTAVIFHGAWNLNAIFMSWLISEPAPVGWIGSLQQNHLNLLPLSVFMILSLVTLLSLPLMGMVTNQPISEENPSEVKA